MPFLLLFIAMRQRTMMTSQQVTLVLNGNTVSVKHGTAPVQPVGTVPNNMQHIVLHLGTGVAPVAPVLPQTPAPHIVIRLPAPATPGPTPPTLIPSMPPITDGISEVHPGEQAGPMVDTVPAGSVAPPGAPPWSDESIPDVIPPNKPITLASFTHLTARPTTFQSTLTVSPTPLRKHTLVPLESQPIAANADPAAAAETPSSQGPAQTPHHHI